MDNNNKLTFRFRRTYTEHTFVDVEAEDLEDAWTIVESLSKYAWQWQDKGHHTTVELLP